MSEDRPSKRILIFSLAYLPFVGGAEIAVREILQRLPSDYRCDLITLRFNSALPRQETIGNLTVHRIGFSRSAPSMADMRRFPLHLVKYWYPFGALLHASQLHKKNPFSVSWCIMANYAGFAALFFKWKYRRVPFLLTLQEGDPEEYIFKRVGILKFLYTKIFTTADRIQAISHYLADFAKRMGARCPVVVVPNGVSIDNFSSVDASARGEVRAAHAPHADDILLITASRLVSKNAVDDIIRAIPLLPQRVKLLVAGTGTQESFLRTLAREIGIAERVIFLGEISHERLPTYLHASDVFVRPSLSEGMGNAFIEAMAAGLPVVATPVGGIVDFLFDPEKNTDRPSTGIFCEVKKPETIAKAVQRILFDAPLRAQLTENARSLVRQQFDWGVVTGRMQKEAFEPLLVSVYTDTTV